MNKIDINKQYKYHNGEPARVLCTDAAGRYPVITVTPEGYAKTHTLAGKWDEESAQADDWDLIEIIQLWRGELWVNEHGHISQFGPGCLGWMPQGDWRKIAVVEERSEP